MGRGAGLGVQPACTYNTRHAARPKGIGIVSATGGHEKRAIGIGEDKKSCWLHLQGGWRNINHTVVQGQQQPRPYAARTGGIARKWREAPPFLLFPPSPSAQVRWLAILWHRRSSSLFVCVCDSFLFGLLSNQPDTYRHTKDQREPQSLGSNALGFFFLFSLDCVCVCERILN